MNYAVRQLYVPTGTLLTSGDTESLLGTSNKAKIGFYNPSSFAALSSASGVSELFVAFGSGHTKYGSFKTGTIKQDNIISFEGFAPDTSVKQQITYIGFDEIEQSKSPTFKCDEEYVVTLRIYESYSASVYQPLIQESVRVKTACCTDCSGNCDDLDCKVYMQEIVDKINANPLLSKYVTASLASSCTGTPATIVYALTVTDPGTNVGGLVDVKLDTTAATGFNDGTYTGITMTSTSGSGTGATFDFTVAGNVITAVSVNAAGSGYVGGEVITFAGTKITGGTTPADDFTITVTATDGPEGDILTELRSMYSSFVTTAETDIVVTSDTDGDGDSDSTGNIRFELTPIAGVEVTDLPAYNGVAWEEITLSAGTETCTGCGVKIVGNTLDEFGNTCIPDAVPYIANLVRFKAIVHEGPYNTMDFDIPDECDTWAVTTTQNIKYPNGTGAQMAEFERHYFRNNLPNVEERGYFWNPLYNNDVTNLLVDTTKTYFQYILKWYENSPQAFEKKTKEAHELVILVDTANTTLANSIEGFLSTFTGTTVNIA